MAQRLTFQSLRYHRNGSFGVGYYAARFTCGRDQLAAVVFDEAEHVAILDDGGRSWRCEDFEQDLRAFIDSAAGQSMAWPTLPTNDNAAVQVSA